MNIDSLKNILSVAITVAKTLAAITSSKVDDNIVAFLEKIAASDAVWQIVAALLKLVPNTVPTTPAPHDGGLIVVGSGAPMKVSGAVMAEAAAAGVSDADLEKALAGADIKGIDLGSITMLIQLAIAIFKAIKK